MSQPEWTDAGAEACLAEGEHLLVEVDGIPVAVFRAEGQILAIENLCTHDYRELASGKLEGTEIICPRHGARFCLKTGRVLAAPAYEDLRCFAVRVEEGRIQVRSLG
jgi:3-phenylpropionate/trans-cinnamate dioxygenase ferredoxin subunit